MDRNDLIRRIDAKKTELAPRLVEYEKLVAGAVDEKKETRPFTAEEFERHEKIAVEVNALNSEITTARAMLKAIEFSDAEDEQTASDMRLSGVEKLPQASEEYKEDFCDFIRNGAKDGSKLYSHFGANFQNLEGTSPSTGSVLIPTTLERKILQETAKLSPLMAISRVINIATRKNQIPFIGDIGVLAPRGEAESYVKTEPTLANKNLDIFNFGGLFPVSMELLEDSDGLEAMFGPVFGRALAETVEEYGLKGTGGQTAFTDLSGNPTTLTITNKVPPGILTQAAGIVPPVTGSAVATIAYQDIVNLKQGVVAEARRTGVYLLSAGFETQSLALKGTDGRPMWAPSMIAGQPATLNGSGYYVSDRLADPIKNGTSALFGAFATAHTIAIRKGLTVKTSDHFYFGNNMRAVAADVRFGALVGYNKMIAKLVHPAA